MLLSTSLRKPELLQKARAIAIIATLATVSTLLEGRQAHAQGYASGWTLTTSNSGSTVSASGTNANGSSFGGSAPWPALNTGDYSQEFVTRGQTETGNVNGSVTFTYTWQGGFLNLPPPPKVWVHEQSTAGWVAAGSILQDTKSGSVNDGLGGTPVSNNSPDGYTQGQTSHGSKWEQEDSSSGTFSVTVSSNATVSVSQTLPPLRAVSGATVGSASFGASTATGDRTIVTNGDIETSYYKVFDPNHGQFEASPHLRAPDGSITTDSGVFWKPGISGNPGSWCMGDTTFSATSPFSDTVTYAWSCDNGIFDSGLNNTNSQILWLISKKDPTSFPLTATVTAKVSGADPGEKDQNTFTATFHLPLENNDVLPTTYSKEVRDTRISGIAPGMTGLVQSTPPQKIDVSGGLDGAVVLFTLSGQEEFSAAAELLSALAKLTNFEFDFGPEAQYNGGANGTDSWTAAKSYNTDRYGGGNLPASPVSQLGNGWVYCLETINEVADYHTDHWTADGYTAHGYDGNSNHPVSVTQTDSIHDEPYFTAFRPPPPPIKLPPL